MLGEVAAKHGVEVKDLPGLHGWHLNSLQLGTPKWLVVAGVSRGFGARQVGEIVRDLRDDPFLALVFFRCRWVVGRVFGEMCPPANRPGPNGYDGYDAN